MNVNSDFILHPNSEFERKNELQTLFLNDVKLSAEDQNVLKACTTEDHESVGLIGCLLNDGTYVNKARLIIASNNQYNDELAYRATELLSCTESELQALIEVLSDIYIMKFEQISVYENKVYGILFDVLN
ncbi:MAG: hypothetical protein ABJH28_18640 [Paraglaciecola sp.]|uniref:hypothetical protein n=1 Tax=Paraglaciecola sp. TaxID=1920173 RepID=UPI0032633902